MEVIAKYYVETDLPIEKAAEAIAAEQSTGTWTEVERERLASDLAARVVRAEGNFGYVAFPEELFEAGTHPPVPAVVAGNPLLPQGRIGGSPSG